MNKIVAAATLVALTATGLSYSYADNETNTVNQFKQMKFERIELTDEQKAEMQAQREEKQVQREAHEAVIDALLAGETLTADQEVIRAEIIEQRAERKIKMEERKEKMLQFKEIRNKIQSWEDLTADEQALLDEMKSHKGGKQKGFKGKHRQEFHGKLDSEES